MTSNEIDALHAEITALRKDITDLQESMKPIIEAYNAGSFTFRAISAIAQFTVAIGSAGGVLYFLYGWVKSH